MDSASSSLLIVLSAPSGGGKTTLSKQVLATNPNLIRVITCTTREPRAGEQDGIDYYFLSAADFLKRVQAGNFIEHATVYGHSYGTLKSELLNKLRSGRDVLLTVDVQGVAALKARAEQEPELRKALITIFLIPSSLAVLRERLQKRGTDSEAVCQKRLSVAKQELGQWKTFDYIVLSNSVEEDLRRMRVIIEAEKMKQNRSRTPVYE